MLIRLKDVKKHSESCRKFTRSNFNVSIIEYEAKKLGVKVSKAKSVEAFLEALKILQAERRKAENVLLDDIE